MEIDFNLKAFFLSVGPFLTEYRDAFGVKTVEGIIGGGAWNEKVTPGAKRFKEAFMKKFKVEPSYWGHLYFYSSLQFFEKAIEEAGTLNQAKIRDLMATRTYDTAMGPMKFEKNINVTHPGEVGQWQNGVYEIIDPGKKRPLHLFIPNQSGLKRRKSRESDRKAALKGSLSIPYDTHGLIFPKNQKTRPIFPYLPVQPAIF